MRISTSKHTQRAVADHEHARAALGGLQDHSIGPLYPWAVVGRGLEGKWEVHNLQESTVVHYRGVVWQGTCSEALGVAHMAKQGIDFMLDYTAQPEPRRQFVPSAGVALGELPARPYAGRATGYDLRAQIAAEAIGAVVPLTPEEAAALRQPLDLQVDP